MIEADRMTFAEGLFMLGEAFNEPVSDVRAEAYFEALKDLPLEAVNRAIRASLRASKFFPKPVELREAIEGNANDKADLAWGDVIREIRRVGWCGVPKFADDRTLPALEAVWGTWRNLCETLPAEGAELVGWVKQFKGTYGTVDRRESHERLTMANVHPNIRAMIREVPKALK